MHQNLVALIFIFALSMLPHTTLAEESIQEPADTITKEAVTSPATSLQSSNENPMTNIGKVGSGSSEDGGALQPAGNNPLQSNSAGADGLASPNNQLQLGANADEVLQVIAGDTDGPRQTPEDASTPAWVWFVIIGGILASLELVLFKPQLARYYQKLSTKLRKHHRRKP